ncbi:MULTISPECIES: YcaO-like family protein [unclassified Aureimonas]|uniref:YcaO-like family protein n=1 Tax=unclassified Aureimonas TaxID=2615206 RepID=UPI000700EF2E|nr:MULTISPECIES: YcaO-like family protein [unclassified Aureimonas]KQT69084.1 hypothetical protein ASG54_05405 [Aureimonas sp. Leaf460]KQT69322.1 hypothetical protein ASG62_18010 [Aureimonas sp. Leaf427]
MTLAGTLPLGGRIREASETVRGLRPHLADLGISRLACQTGLDRIGIPVWAAMRPNSLSLAVNQGKGTDDHAARASALMEAAEFAIAEAPDADVVITAKADLLAAGHRVFDPARLLAEGAAIPADEPIGWLAGRQLIGGETVFIPLEAARLDLTQEVYGGLSRSSNGLASGNNEDEAVLHALCELVERDALTLLTFRAGRSIGAARIDPAAFESPAIDDLTRRIREAGFKLDLFDLTTGLGIPVVQATIREARGPVRLQLDLAAGVGCHPFAAVAAIRAITEAAQTRITNIAGARDDIDPAEYDEPLRPGLRFYLEEAGPARAPVPASVRPEGAVSPRSLLDAVTEKLARAGITDLPLAVLGGARQGIAVVKLFAPQLEDRPANRNWRPGPRIASAMMRLW